MDNIVSITDRSVSPNSFLEEAYRTLGYEEGSLFDAVPSPSIDAAETAEWLEKGDWLTLAQKIGAKKVFFVKNDPVIVFCEYSDPADVPGIIRTFRKAWCMARPSCLFLALTGELRVYSLNATPPKEIKDWSRIEPLAIVHRIAEVAEKLQGFRREEVESGRLFADQYFGDINERADRRLIQDLKNVRECLLDNGLNHRHAHALIGRSIFVRYLEDRGILTPEYFQEIAKGHTEWQEILQENLEKPGLMIDLGERRYHSVLRSKEFTYALFKQLAQHFNGNMFPEDDQEETAVTQDHLIALRQFLLGERDSDQLSLFFWAYDFKIIPTELISSIYEEFYHELNDDDKGTHYTPSVLVEFALSQTLPPERLANKPRILDPACGSGIFLVEAFRRIVRYNVQQLGRSLTSQELRSILRTQIAGIEINAEAIHVTAFSLYLALLHYQEPPDILAQIKAAEDSGKPLPHLIFKSDQIADDSHYQTLVRADTFALTYSEQEELRNKLAAKARFAGRSEIVKLVASNARLPLNDFSFDIIIGNPPWGFKNAASPEIQQAQERAQRWCNASGWPIGDKELSQAFIARTLRLIKPDGFCGLLVSTGVFFKHHENSRKFRKQWLKKCTVAMVVNFAHVRDVFFNSAIAPFAFVLYDRSAPDPSHRVRYWSAKKTGIVNRTRAVILRLPDLRQVKQLDFGNNESLWKVYWWGSHRDAALITAFTFEKTLGQLVDEREWIKGQGYTPGSATSRGWLRNYRELPIDLFGRYGSVKKNDLTKVPRRVHRRGIRELYSGPRLLIKRGITQAEGADGRLEARLDRRTFCFRNSIHAIRMDGAKDWERKALVGILWSSLARYFFFATASSWGTWHHEVHLEEVLGLPIRIPESGKLRDRLIGTVDELRSPDGRARVRQLERKLDDAVFDLYELGSAERDLIRDMCQVGLEFFYNRGSSNAVRPIEVDRKHSSGSLVTLGTLRNQQGHLASYLNAFLEIWNRQLEPKGEFEWQVIRSSGAPMLAVVFATREKSPSTSLPLSGKQYEWDSVLERCEAALLQPIGRNVYIDGMVRAVTDTEIIVIKRDEQWLWTRSVAREDAEATLLQAVHLQEAAMERTR